MARDYSDNSSDSYQRGFGATLEEQQLDDTTCPITIPSRAKLLYERNWIIFEIGAGSIV